MIDHVTGVGPVTPEGLLRHRRCESEAKNVTEYCGRVLHAIQRFLEGLTFQVPMPIAKNLTEDI